MHFFPSGGAIAMHIIAGLYGIQFVPHHMHRLTTDVGSIGAGHQPSIGSGIIQNGSTSRQRGRGIQEGYVDGSGLSTKNPFLQISKSSSVTTPFPLKSARSVPRSLRYSFRHCSKSRILTLSSQSASPTDFDGQL